MNNLELFNLIKKDAEYFSIEDILKKSAPKEQDQQLPFDRIKYVSRSVADYNLKTFLEIKNRDCLDVTEQVNVDAYEEFTFRIDKYLNKHAPGQDDLRKYIKIVSTYLAFIARKPLHPPGMIFESGLEIVSKDNKFYCPEKNKQNLGAMSLCKYCVSNDISAMNDVSDLADR